MKDKFILALALVAILLNRNPVKVQAQGPVNTDPGTTLVFDNLPHPIPANTALWFAFFYAGDKSPITITMRNAANTGLGFNVYTPEQVRRMKSEDKPLGRGTAVTAACDSGKCSSSDLTWTGSTPTSGAYIIQVMNTAGKSHVFDMIVSGTGVETGPPLEVRPPPPPSAVVPVAGSFPMPFNLLPENAITVKSGQPQVIPANSALWYRLESGDARLPALIALPAGVNSGIYFRVFTADEVKKFAQDFDFLGEGMAPVFPCEVSACAPNDLVWENVFPAPGTYYVQVLNSNTAAMLFRLIIAGNALSPGQ